MRIDLLFRDVLTAVVSRGGRVDLARAALPALRAPVVMIVGGTDVDTLERSRDAARQLRTAKRLAVVAGPRHTFEEPGALGAMGEHAVTWLDQMPCRP